MHNPRLNLGFKKIVYKIYLGNSCRTLIMNYTFNDSIKLLVSLTLAMMFCAGECFYSWDLQKNDISQHLLHFLDGMNKGEVFVSKSIIHIHTYICRLGT